MIFNKRKKNKKETTGAKDLKVNSTFQTKPNKVSTMQSLKPILRYNLEDYHNGRFRYQLYQFLSEQVPAVNACLETWVRLSAAPGNFIVNSKRAENILSQLSNRIFRNVLGSSSSMTSFLSELFTSLYRDGLFSGFLTVRSDADGIDRFIPVKAADIMKGENNRFYLEINDRKIDLHRNDYYLIPNNADQSYPMGKSILQSVSFVSYIEQQLVDDMRRTSHNSGYHRLHVKITPPERMSGESDKAFIDRINGYFDSTVSMIKSCDINENPVTWDNVTIDHVGPENVKAVTNSWFMNHRAMIEEICAGTNLAPFLLGYSFGTTTTWASFKFDIVMRQIQSVQAEVASFLEWIGNIELALHGIEEKCCFEFDNTFAYRAIDESTIRSKEVDSLLKLYQAGLIDETSARQKAGKLL